MMYITVGEKTHELKTTLGIAKRIEIRFKVPMSELFSKLGSAEVEEMTEMLSIAAGKPGDKEFKAEIEDEWDYMNLFDAVKELVAKLLFSGPEEEIERRLDKFEASDAQKNVLRGLLGLPAVKSGGESSSEPPTE